MIIQRVAFTNFGVYGGRNEFELIPRTDEQFSRPIVLFSGKNGAGKTTFVEGIRLCLHGSLALGDRVSRSDYEDHLLRKIHRPFQEGVTPPDAASIEMEFEFVRNGERHTYRVERSWHRTKKSVSESLSITEDGKPPEGLEEDQKDGFLRELVPSSAADLFFFDGEKIDKLTDEEEGSEILGQTVESLLGLHLVDRLDTDLEVFISRRAEKDDSEVSEELEEARQEVERLRERMEELKIAQEETQQSLQEKSSAIDTQRQRLKSEGGDYAERRDELERRQEVLEQKIETQEKHIQSLADGIMPFAVAPQMCEKVRERLDIERQHQEWKTSEQLIEEQISQFADEVESDSFWEQVGIDPDEKTQSQLLDALTERLRESNPAEPVDEDEVVIHASERERGKLNSWIDEALNGIPDTFREATQKLTDLREELEEVEEDLSRVPQDLILQPIVETLNTLVEERDELQARAEEIADDIGTVEFKLERAESHLENVKDRLEEEQKENERVQQALRTQKALRDYANRLKRKKLNILEDTLASRFNELCRKETILDAVDIDAETFEVVLHRGNQTFGREALSAGETQLFAIATIWALREVSGVPMPVIIDTPLGRLDDDHRSKMIQTYLPRASHQVMLLATDAEVDEDVLEDLEPALSHTYRLRFDEDVQRTQVDEIDIDAGQQKIFEEVAA
ncbi:DNA sulfur modification protein DndD [Salinibacter ruber]|uniref:DNA sulfur modification protein DndD n=1 Tax=Salinibacter ruber TaxID=146919 RepID=UPI00216810A2|nr:DNA sulfur modification protein DndD [Salinibacter ruber]MCS4149280.1 DNA sulfur modification protein DndD [Salinibacter ruber]